ncbi:hypothetical protein CQZ94_28495 [Bacillus sp. MYb209]|nr:hypothetical protein CQZ94_28495 [Bacillus sp. MYb209]
MFHFIVPSSHDISDNSLFKHESVNSFHVVIFIVLAKKTPSSRNVKGVSRWEMNWLRTRDGRKPS